MHASCEQYCDLSKILDEFSVAAYNAKKSSHFLSFFSSCMILMASIFNVRGFITWPVLRIWPKY